MFAQINAVRDWREAVEKIRELHKEYSRNFPIMTQYERTMGEEALSRATTFYRSLIEDGVVGEFSAAVRQYQASQARIERARAEEIRSWDPARLAAELQVTEARVSQSLTRPDPVGELHALETEAHASGDRYKLRAFCEVVRGSLAKLHSNDPDVGRLVNRLGQNADRELSALRESDALRGAISDGETAFHALIARHRELDSTARTLGDLVGGGGPYKGPVGKAWQRIHPGENGEMVIDPE